MANSTISDDNFNHTMASLTGSSDFPNQDIVELFPWSTSGLDGDWVGRIITSLTLVFGTFGNIMTVTILRRLQHGWTSMNIYLTALAVSDSGMLYSGVLGTWCRKTLQYDLGAHNRVGCKLIAWMVGVSGCLSAWLLVALTVQRALSVVWPHRINVVCTPRSTAYTVAVITVIMTGLYSHMLYGIDLVFIGNSETPKCTFKDLEYQEFYGSVFVRVDIFLFSVGPSAFMLLGNAVLAWKLSASIKEAKNKLMTGSFDAITTRKQKASSATITVIVVSMTFVLLTLPLMIYNSFFHLMAENPETRALHYFIYETLGVISLTNFAINFYLYFLTGSKFKNEFLKLVCGCSRRKTDPVQTTTVTNVSDF